MIHFFMPMRTPTITNQEHKVRVIKGKPIIYEPDELKSAKALITDSLAKYKPKMETIKDPVRLTVKWLFPTQEGHHNQEYKYTKPDTDNLDKMLKDCMTRVGFWKDDALVVSEIIEKFWADPSGIYIKLEVWDGSEKVFK